MNAIEEDSVMIEDGYCACCGFPRSIYLNAGHHPECIWSEPPKPPIIGLDMGEDEEHRRQIELLMGQIMSPIYNLQRLLNVGGLM